MVTTQWHPSPSLAQLPSSSHHIPGLVTLDCRVSPKPQCVDADALATALSRSSRSDTPPGPYGLFSCTTSTGQPATDFSPKLCRTPRLALLVLQGPLSLSSPALVGPGGPCIFMEGVSRIWTASHSRPGTDYLPSTCPAITLPPHLRPAGSPQPPSPLQTWHLLVSHTGSALGSWVVMKEWGAGCRDAGVMVPSGPGVG